MLFRSPERAVAGDGSVTVVVELAHLGRDERSGLQAGDIVEFVNDHLTVGDPDNDPVTLDDNGAAWNRPMDYGTKINPQDAKPGDIVQFKSVKMVETFPDGSWRSETLGMPDHTAIIYEVIAPLKFRLAHQNLNGNRTVQITEVNLKNKKSGSFSIHRPRAGLLLD